MRSLLLAVIGSLVLLPLLARGQDASVLAAGADAGLAVPADAGALKQASALDRVDGVDPVDGVDAGAAAPIVAAAPSEPHTAAAGPALAAKADQEPERDPEHEAPQAEATAADGEVVPGKRYTADLDDEALETRWKEDPASLGPLSIGFADAGRLVNSVRFPDGPLWVVADPAHTYTTEEVVAYLKAAIEEVNAVYPESEPLRVGHISRPDGGWLRPHISHQAGRDVDLSFYLTPFDPAKRKADRFDVARNWALLRALLVTGDVQFVLVDKKLIQRLWDYAKSIGEDADWLTSLFKNGMSSMVFHARRHRDHFHVRYYSPRSQELGRRVQPLMPKGKPEYNFTVHRIRSGDNLGKLAHKYDTTITAIKKANGTTSSFLRAGRTLTIPLGTACIDCPVPPEVVVPPRRLPPSTPALLTPPPRPETAAAPPTPAETAPVPAAAEAPPSPPPASAAVPEPKLEPKPEKAAAPQPASGVRQ
ncbi:MAG TPA: penicillin-insensitive murein endopeptidase [Myxococcales bacterium]|jgi:LysM repeat protein